jgi:polyisoprenoid-binding protein YceI
MALERWKIDTNHSGIHFSVRHLMIARVRGEFARWSGSVLVPDGDFGRGSVEVVIEAASLETGVGERDAHLKSADFLDVASHPEITFTGKRVEVRAANCLRLFGDLTIRGAMHEVVLEVEPTGQIKDPWGSLRAGFTAKASVDRKEFGLVWNQVLEAGGVMVGERVDIEIEIEAVSQGTSKPV